MKTEDMEIFTLVDNPVKDYAWGKTSRQCMVAKLAQTHQYENYAELWMGMHPNGQSKVSGSSDSSPQILSRFLAKKYIKYPAFLFKVLSIEKCLSIQVHPSKVQAEKLYAYNKNIYKDANDKPEMFYTISDSFQCFLGYIPSVEFERVLNQISIMNPTLSFEGIDNSKAAIEYILGLSKEEQYSLYHNSLDKLHKIHPSRYPAQKMKKNTKKMQKNAQKMGQNSQKMEENVQKMEENAYKNNKMLKIVEDFPDDIGLVISFFLEHKKMGKGQCYFIDAGTPHAYIYGQCLQIMKNSDNVCRLGLTPKLKDLKVIKDVLGPDDLTCQGVKIYPKQLNQTYRFNHQNSEKQLQLSNSEFSYKNLHLHNISYSLTKIVVFDNENIQENSINHPKDCEFLSVSHDKCEYLQFALILEGNFRITRLGMEEEKVEKCFTKGEVIILEPFENYQIGIPKNVGIGFMCIGWSTY